MSCQEKVLTQAYIKPAVSETAPAASVACTSNVPATNTRHGGNNAEGVAAACSRGRTVEVDNERSKVIRRGTQDVDVNSMGGKCTVDFLHFHGFLQVRVNEKVVLAKYTK